MPVLRKFKHMAMCHELGMAMFDITKDAIRDFLYEPGSRLPKDATQNALHQHNGTASRVVVVPGLQVHAHSCHT